MLELAQVTLVGTSLGGHVAAQVAATAPDRIEQLLLVGTLGVVPLTSEQCAALSTSITTTSRPGIRHKLQRVVHDPQLVTDEWVEEEYRINNSPGAAGALRCYARYLAAGINEHVLSDAFVSPSARPDTWLLWGADDVVTPVAMATATRDRLQAPLSWIPHAGHAPYHEQADVFNTEFLACVG